jgi:CBS-domain-containing membrane protein
LADQIRPITAVERARDLAAVARGQGLSAARSPLATVYHRFSGHSWPHRPVHITSASASGPASATAAGGERATLVSLQPRITDSDLQAVVNETHEVYDIDADDLRDLLERLEARIGAR